MVVMLNSGEAVHGVIEWYDKRCIKLSRVGKPALLIMKTAIRFMRKEQSGAPNNSAQVGKVMLLVGQCFGGSCCPDGVYE
jgi:sRNA-binding regulator protein Hfq